MSTNLDNFKKDLEKLLQRAKILHIAMQHECYPEDFKKRFGDKYEEYTECLPKFSEEYQTWYSEALVLIKQIIPDRLEDFKRLYEKPRNRKDISFENYRIEDYLQGLVVRVGIGGARVGLDSAIPEFRQQIAILKSVEKRFESSLFDIQQLLQADLFDSELEAAIELSKKGFLRGAGAIAGVVLEKHLEQVCTNHGLKSKKKNPTINDFNELLKTESIIDVPIWRNIQRLGDIRNLCDHSKDREPTAEEVEELILGVEKMSKTLF